MAKGFFTLQEAMERLGKNEQEIRNLVREGQLREFRDGGNVLYKEEDVASIASGGTGALEALTEEVGPGDSGDLVLDAADSAAGGSDVDLGLSGSGTGIPMSEESGIGDLQLEPAADSSPGLDMSSSETSLTLDGADSATGAMSDASAAALEALAGDTGAGASATEMPLDVSGGTKALLAWAHPTNQIYLCRRAKVNLHVPLR